MRSVCSDYPRGETTTGRGSMAPREGDREKRRGDGRAARAVAGLARLTTMPREPRELLVCKLRDAWRGDEEM